MSFLHMSGNVLHVLGRVQGTWFLVHCAGKGERKAFLTKASGISEILLLLGSSKYNRFYLCAGQKKQPMRKHSGVFPEEVTSVEV